jgi:hypothetical protein
MTRKPAPGFARFLIACEFLILHAYAANKVVSLALGEPVHRSNNKEAFPC